MQETIYGPALVIADRGHVWVGHVTVNQDGCLITAARAVRRWGTTAGLNELISGPQSKTVLDAPAPRLIVAARAVIAVIPVEAAPWAKHLGM